MKKMYGILHGLILALCYLLLKKLDDSGGIALFSLSTLLSFAVHSLINPRAVMRSILNRGIVIRGAIFGLTQVFLLHALTEGETSSVLIASSLGTIVGLTLGTIFLKEKVRGWNLAGLLTSVIGSLLQPNIYIVTSSAIIGGAVQGLGAFMTRRLMIEPQIHVFGAVAGTMGYGAIMTLLALMEKNNINAFYLVKLESVLLMSVIVTIVQYSVFFLYRILNSQLAGSLALSRIPLAILFEVLAFGVYPTKYGIASAVFILLGALMILTPQESIFFHPFQRFRGHQKGNL